MPFTVLQCVNKDIIISYICKLHNHEPHDEVYVRDAIEQSVWLPIWWFRVHAMPQDLIYTLCVMC